MGRIQESCLPVEAQPTQAWLARHYVGTHDRVSWTHNLSGRYKPPLETLSRFNTQFGS